MQVFFMIFGIICHYLPPFLFSFSLFPFCLFFCGLFHLYLLFLFCLYFDVFTSVIWSFFSSPLSSAGQSDKFISMIGLLLMRWMGLFPFLFTKYSMCVILSLCCDQGSVLKRVSPCIFLHVPINVYILDVEMELPAFPTLIVVHLAINPCIHKKPAIHGLTFAASAETGQI